MKMHSQSELENYKLQVELLHEKLHRSEDIRQELGKKLEQIMKKRNEHEEALRSRSQLKYQQFLDEQKKRNERNRKLVEMLARIEEQGAALSAKSERLKIMKLQYEIYFSKLVQSCRMKKLHNTATFSLRYIQRPSNISQTLKLDDETFPKEAPRFLRAPLPVVIPNEQNPVQQGWTIGCAQPGVLITLPNNTTLPMPSDNTENKKIQPNFCFDYSQFPIGYIQAATSIIPMQYNVAHSSFLQQPHHHKTISEERHTKQSLEVESRVKIPSCVDVKTNKTIANTTQTNELVCGNKSEKHKCLVFEKDEKYDQESTNFNHNRVQVFDENCSALHQSLKIDKLPNIKLNNYFEEQQIQERRRIIHEENIPNTIDFRSDRDNENNKYIEYNKEVEQAYDKNHLIPISLASEELSIDNVTTTFQIKKTEKIDETNARDDENINVTDENEKNTSPTSSATLDVKCTIGSVGDEALTFIKKPLEYTTEKHISDTASARNIDPSRDTEQITLFNGTQNSQDESTRASNRTTAIIGGDVGENKENTENRRMDSNTNPSISIYHPLPFDKKEKMSIENIETAIYGELLMKPENLTFSDDADNLRGNGGDDKEIERNFQQNEGYEFSNLEQDSYKQDPVMETEHQQVISHATEIEDIKVKQNSVIENTQGSHPYNDYVDSVEEQQYNIQNYSDPGAIMIDEGGPKQDYSFTEEEQYPQNNNYALDCQNYNISQYQTEYDTTEYPYDFTQCDETNHTQYATDTYSKDYQQDQYAGYEENYEENAQLKGPTSYQGYNEGRGNEGVFENKVNIDDTKNLETLREKLNEQSTESQPYLNLESETTHTKHQPASILSTEKCSDLIIKKKKRVNFVDSETDECSTQQKQGAISSESDFDFSNN